MPGGHEQVSDRDAFLKGAVNADVYKTLPREANRSRPRPSTSSSLVRPGTSAYQGTKKVKKKTGKKKTGKKKLAGKTADEMILDELAKTTEPRGYTQPAYEDPDSPSLDDIERAKAIIAKAGEKKSPFVMGEVSDAALANEFVIEDIDKDAPKEEESDEGPPDILPPELIEHECGLPECLRLKEEIVKYLIAHGISHKIRKAMDITGEEHTLYESHSRDQKQRRAALSHFAAALRLYRNGYPVNPKAEVDLNAMAGVK